MPAHNLTLPVLLLCFLTSSLLFSPLLNAACSAVLSNSAFTTDAEYVVTKLAGQFSFTTPFRELCKLHFTTRYAFYKAPDDGAIFILHANEYLTLTVRDSPTFLHLPLTPPTYSGRQRSKTALQSCPQ